MIVPKPRAIVAGIAAAALAATVVVAAVQDNPPDPTLKPVLAGVLDRQGQPAAAVANVVDAWVVNVTWAQLQPTQGGPIAANNPVDQAVTAAAALGAHIKVRVGAAISAPAWVKSVGGAPVTINDPVDGGTGTVGRFWTTAYGNAYVDLQTKLAARYDTVPQVAEVTTSRCTTVYAEPMIRQIADPTTVANLRAAGYTLALDLACQRASLDAHKVWTTTRSGYAINPYQQINATTVNTDVATTATLADYCKATLGARCVLANNSIGTPMKAAGGYSEMYAALLAQPRPIAFQTETPTKVGDLAATLAWAADNGAAYVELPNGYATSPTLTSAQLAQYDAQLEANSAPVPPPTTTTTTLPPTTTTTVAPTTTTTTTTLPPTTTTTEPPTTTTTLPPTTTTTTTLPPTTTTTTTLPPTTTTTEPPTTTTTLPPTTTTTEPPTTTTTTQPPPPVGRCLVLWAGPDGNVVHLLADQESTQAACALAA